MVVIPTRAIHRSPAYFKDPDSFIPDRWLDPTSTDNKAAFIPFAAGNTSCTGRHLAQMEMRMALCALLKHFDMKFAEGWNPDDWERNLLDHSTLASRPLPIRLTLRN